MILDNSKYGASINFEIKTYEIDAAGHVNNIVYIKWLEDLRCKLFSQFFPVENLLEEDLYPVVTSTKIDYKKQLKLGNKPTGTVQAEFLGHGLMQLKFRFINNDKVCAAAEQKCVLMNLKTGLMDKRKFKSLQSI